MNTTEYKPTIEVLVCLVCLDMAHEGTDVMPIGELADWLEQCGADVHYVTTDTVPHWRTGEPIRRHRITFSRLRASTAHDLGFRAGYVVHIEPDNSLVA